MKVPSITLIYYFTEQYLRDLRELNDKRVFGELWYLKNNERSTLCLSWPPL